MATTAVQDTLSATTADGHCLMCTCSRRSPHQAQHLFLPVGRLDWSTNAGTPWLTCNAAAAPSLFIAKSSNFKCLYRPYLSYAPPPPLALKRWSFCTEHYMYCMPLCTVTSVAWIWDMHARTFGLRTQRARVYTVPRIVKEHNTKRWVLTWKLPQGMPRRVTDPIHSCTYWDSRRCCSSR